MSLLDLAKELFSVKSKSVKKERNPYHLTDFYQTTILKTPFIYFTETEQYNINKKFKDLDGYFTKLVYDNNIIGYVFRCTHRNIKFEDKNGVIYKYPYFVTCYFQEIIPGVSLETLKIYGKAHAIKTGLRTLQKLIKISNEDSFAIDIKKFDFENIFDCIGDDGTHYPYWFGAETPEDNKEILEYLRNFDKKIYKYYNEVDQKDIGKFWLTSFRDYDI